MLTLYITMMAATNLRRLFLACAITLNHASRALTTSHYGNPVGPR
jgi:hypothetical protein